MPNSNVNRFGDRTSSTKLERVEKDSKGGDGSQKTIRAPARRNSSAARDKQPSRAKQTVIENSDKNEPGIR